MLNDETVYTGWELWRRRLEILTSVEFWTIVWMCVKGFFGNEEAQAAVERMAEHARELKSARGAA